jgi:hypothetical protein
VQTRAPRDREVGVERVDGSFVLVLVWPGQQVQQRCSVLVVEALDVPAAEGGRSDPHVDNDVEHRAGGGGRVLCRPGSRRHSDAL